MNPVDYPSAEENSVSSFWLLSELLFVPPSLPLATTQVREDEVTQMRHEISKLSKAREIIQRKLRVAEEQKVEAEHERDTLKNQISGLERGRDLYMVLDPLW